MEKVELSRIVDRLESGSRQKGGSVGSGVISIGGTHLSNNGGFKWDKREFISEDFYVKLRSGKVKYQDILIVKDGATTGKTSFVDENFPYKDAAINEHVFRLEINQNQANPKYVFYFLYSPTGQEQILNDFRGATVGGISRGFIDKAIIPLPDLETQNKIVAILDKAKAILDKREETVAQYDELLRATFLEMFGDSITNPNGWEKNTLESLCSKIIDCLHETPEYTIENSNFYCVRSSDIQNNYFELKDTKMVSEETYLRRIARHEPKLGEVIYTREGGRLGNAARVPDNYNICLGQRMMLFAANEKISNNEFIWALLNSDSIKNQVINMSGGGAAPRINIRQLRALEVIHPPLELQSVFAKRVNKIEAIKNKLNISLEEITNLFKSISQKAFLGELEFNTAVDLEVLLENDYQFFKEKSNTNSIKLLLERLDKNELNNKKFSEQEIYDKAKSFAFELLKEGKVKQVFDKKTNRVKLTV